MEYIAVLTYSENYKKPLPEDFLTFIRAYPTDFILLKLSKINAILFQERDRRSETIQVLKEVVYVDTLFGTEDHLLKIMSKIPSHMVLFSASAISLMIKACLENYVEHIPDLMVNSANVSSDLFSTILIFNELYYSRFHDDDLQSFKGIFHLDMIQRNYLGHGFYQKFIATMKLAFVSKFLSTNDRLREECMEFCNYYGIGNPWLYGYFFIMVVITPSQKDEVAKHIFDVTGVPERLILDFTFKRDTVVTKEELSMNMDLVPKPFYLFHGEHPLILDYNYFQYAIEQGVFYSFYNNTSLKNGNKFKNFNAFKSFIGLNYFEQFLVSKYLHAIFFRKSQRVVSTEIFQDFIVRSGDNVLIFEVKMTDLHAKSIENLDFEAFKNFIEQNFLSEKLSGGKNKGISQILVQMGHLLEDNALLCSLLGAKVPTRLNIYPIIVYSDGNLDTSGVNFYVSQQFELRVASLKNNFQSVKPLLMMNVNTLVEYFSLFKNGPHALTGLISNYFKSIDSMGKLYHQFKGTSDYFQMNKSFSNYLNTKINKNQLDNNLVEMQKDFDLDIQGNENENAR